MTLRQSIHALVGVVLLASGGAAAEPDRISLPDPPAGVEGADLLEQGDFAIEYAFEWTRFENLRDERRAVSATEVLLTTPYQSAPSRVDIEQHDLTLRYAPLERVTVSATLPILRKSMDNLAAGGSFTTRSSGVGDLQFLAVARFMERGQQQTFVSLGLGAPTGAIRERDDTPAGRQRLPYPMQLGAGVWSFEPGLSYRGRAQKLSWGGQAVSTLYVGENDNHYRPGDRYRVMAWLAGDWTSFLRTSLRAQWQHWGNVKGRDPALDPIATPVADPMEQKGERVDLGVGLDLHWPGLSGRALEFEASFPVYERLDGPQPSFDWRLRAGLRWAF